MPTESAGFTRRQRMVIFLASWLGWALIWFLNSTVRYRVIGEENLAPFRKTRKAAIVSCWHSQLFSATYLFRFQGAAAITSRHFDGEYIARIIQRFGLIPIRGSSTRGGVGALLSARRCISEGRIVGFMVDGPKGPRERVKLGPIFLSRVTSAPLVPFHIEVERRWELNTWDRFRIPKPFSRAIFRIGEPIPLEGADAEVLENYQRAMDRLAEECRDCFLKE